MKSFVHAAAICCVIYFSACKKSEPATAQVTQVTDTTFNINAATLLKQGSFTGNMNYSVSGTVKLYSYQSKNYLYLENYNGSSGLDLRVYISTTMQASQFVSLGKI